MKVERKSITTSYLLKPILDLFFSKIEFPSSISISEPDIAYLRTNYLIPIFYYSIRKRPYLIDKTMFEKLRNIYNDSIAYYIKLKNQHREIKEMLSNIDFIIFKGISLSETLYPMPFLRPQGDIDIIVPSEEVHYAIGLLKDGGYRPIRKPNVSFELSLCMIPPRKGERLIDMHFGFRRRDLMEVEYSELLSNAYKTDMGFFLNRPASLVSLALHAHYHWFSLPLINWLDVIILISKMSDVEINLAKKLADIWGLSKSLSIIISLSSQKWGLNLHNNKNLNGVKNICSFIEKISKLRNEILSKIVKAMTFRILMEDDMKFSYLFNRFVYYMKGGR
ncbi:MAG: nucleotidyltransferase family protein [bacterium]